MNSCRFCQLVLVRHFFAAAAAALHLRIFVSRQILLCLASNRDCCDVPCFFVFFVLLLHLILFFLLSLRRRRQRCHDFDFFSRRNKISKIGEYVFVGMFVVTLLYCKLCTFYAPFPVPWTACKWTNYHCHCYCYCHSFFRGWNSSQVVISFSISAQPIDSIKFLWMLCFFFFVN